MDWLLLVAAALTLACAAWAWHRARGRADARAAAERRAIREQLEELPLAEVIEALAAAHGVELRRRDAAPERDTLAKLGDEDRSFFRRYAEITVAERRFAPAVVGDLVHLCTLGEGRALIALGGMLYVADAESGDLTPADQLSVPRLALQLERSASLRSGTHEPSHSDLAAC